MSTTAGLRPHDERSPRRGRRDRLASRLALVGAGLGVFAGVAELTFGPSIRDWVGNKQDTTRLGLTTIILSSVALASAGVLQRADSRAHSHRLAVALGLVVPAVICFTTVGRLWLVPGSLLLVAGGLLLSAAQRGELGHAVDERRWYTGLVALCGAYYIFLGATALGLAGLLGVLGGLLIWGAMASASRSRRAAYALLALGALPFAAVTWWSAITPLIAVLALVLGRTAIRQAGGHAREDGDGRRERPTHRPATTAADGPFA
ncbi:MAG: hypothetical protein JWO74_771 [Solirubrobacterales bacterium]|jgi:hypothetical protein|nr:hypothetical protein [Solirubrobacterales bacterium]